MTSEGQFRDLLRPTYVTLYAQLAELAHNLLAIAKFLVIILHCLTANKLIFSDNDEHHPMPL